jgi:hypothetical protein
MIHNVTQTHRTNEAGSRSRSNRTAMTGPHRQHCTGYWLSLYNGDGTAHSPSSSWLVVVVGEGRDATCGSFLFFLSHVFLIGYEVVFSVVRRTDGVRQTYVCCVAIPNSLLSPVSK